MFINVTSGTVSERGVLSVSGVGTVDNIYHDPFDGPYVGHVDFAAFVTTPYSVVPLTPITLTVSTYDGAAYSGAVSYIRAITWDCTSGALLNTSLSQ